MERKILLGLMVFMLISIISFTPLKATAQVKSIELKYAVFVPPTHVMNLEAKAWASEVEKRTNGRVKVTIYPGGTLLAPRMVYEGVLAGTTDIGVLPCIYNRGVWPISIAFNYSLLRFPSANVGTHAINDIHKKYRSLKEFSVMKILYLFTTDPGLVVSRKPIRTVEEAKGLQIKGTAREFLDPLGCKLVDLPMSEAVVGLQKGTIDGAIISPDVLKGMKFADVAKYVSPNLQLGLTGFWIGMNLNTWDSLPADIKKIIDDINQERIGVVGVAWDKAGEEGIEYAKSVGVKFITWPQEEEAKLKELLKPVRETYIAELNGKGLPGREIMDSITELGEKYSKKFSK